MSTSSSLTNTLIFLLFLRDLEEILRVAILPAAIPAIVPSVI